MGAAFAVGGDDWANLRFDPEADAWSSRKNRPASPAYHVNDDRAIEVVHAVFARNPAYIAERGFVDMLVRLVHEPGIKPAIFLCGDKDQENYIAAQHLAQALENAARRGRRAVVRLAASSGRC